MVQTDEERKAKEKARRQTPEYKEKNKEYRSRPENRAKMKAHKQTLEYKAQQKEYRSRPEIIAKEKARMQTPEYKEKKKEYRSRPENRVKTKEYNSRQEVKERQKAYQQSNEGKAKSKAYSQRSENLAKTKSKQLKLRTTVLQTYSKRLSNSDIPCCNCCGINSNLDFLAIDHISGRTQMDSEPKLVKLGYSSKILGMVLQKWIIDNNFPDGFQILCQNCNMAKGMKKNNNECPMKNKPH
jgi:hypothetical protein